MTTDSGTVSGWFTLKAGFKVYGRCPLCASENIAYYRVRTPGLKGISSIDQGITPVCVDCGKGLPCQVTRPKKTTVYRMKMGRV